MNQKEYNQKMSELNRKLLIGEITNEQYEQGYNKLWDQVKFGAAPHVEKKLRGKK